MCALVAPAQCGDRRTDTLRAVLLLAWLKVLEYLSIFDLVDRLVAMTILVRSRARAREGDTERARASDARR